MHVGIDYAAWNAWVRREMDEVLAVNEPAAIVFDGNNPYPGILAAASHSSRTKLCWIRVACGAPAMTRVF
jgi:hypothetical protein